METNFDEVLLARLTPARLSSYLQSTNDNLHEAIRLYEWNARIAAAIFETLSFVEVVVRNAMHRELTRWNYDLFGHGEWFKNDHGKLHTRALADIEIAKVRSTRTHEFLSSDRLVSELNFGFWRFLLAKQYRTTLWPAALQHSFPQLLPNNVADFSRKVARLHDLRNRIAHHEPIHNQNLHEDFNNCVSVLNAVCSQTSEWVMGRSQVPKLLLQRAF